MAPADPAPPAGSGRRPRTEAASRTVAGSGRRNAPGSGPEPQAGSGRGSAPGPGPAPASRPEADPGGPARAALEARWLHLTRTTLPALARPRGWPVVADHCFQRILLDNASGGRWYDRVAGRPAYRHAPATMLAEAVHLAEACVAGEADLPALNRRSLAWRRG